MSESFEITGTAMEERTAKIVRLTANRAALTLLLEHHNNRLRPEQRGEARMAIAADTESLAAIGWRGEP